MTFNYGAEIDNPIKANLDYSTCTTTDMNNAMYAIMYMIGNRSSLPSITLNTACLLLRVEPIAILFWNKDASTSVSNIQYKSLMKHYHDLDIHMLTDEVYTMYKSQVKDVDTFIKFTHTLFDIDMIKQLYLMADTREGDIDYNDVPQTHENRPKYNYDEEIKETFDIMWDNFYYKQTNKEYTSTQHVKICRQLAYKPYQLSDDEKMDIPDYSSTYKLFKEQCVKNKYSMDDNYINKPSCVLIKYTSMKNLFFTCVFNNSLSRITRIPINNTTSFLQIYPLIDQFKNTTWCLEESLSQIE